MYIKEGEIQKTWLKSFAQTKPLTSEELIDKVKASQSSEHHSVKTQAIIKSADTWPDMFLITRNEAVTRHLTTKGCDTSVVAYIARNFRLGLKYSIR